MAMSDALLKAREAGLDLVEIAPTAQPPVCRIMNFGKFIYQQKKKQQDSKKKQKTTQVKEVKFRPNIDDHDYDFKMKNIIKFLSHGDKVKATVQFRGREMARRENGQKVLDRLLIDLTGHAIAESRSEMLGNRLYQILAPVKHEKGTKAAVWHKHVVPAGGSVEIRLRLTAAVLPEGQAFEDFESIFAARQRCLEADGTLATGA